GVDLNAKSEEMKKDSLTESDIEEIELRKVYAEKWLSKCASENSKFHIVEELSGDIKDSLSDSQREFLKSIIPIFEGESLPGDEIHQKIYEATQTVGIKPGEGFKTIYQVFIAKNQGPRVGGFLAALDKSFVIKRLTESL
ncbi:MAG: hypothetical protein OEZ36_06420, partial [Spirochaetota bacterium]|nr:hypothetical protein [Spirochaetota bacterium]